MPGRCKGSDDCVPTEISQAWREVLAETAAAAGDGQLECFLDELLTVAERRDIALRWMVLKSLAAGEPQRKIADRLGMSLCKITRGSKMLKQNGYVGKKFDLSAKKRK